MAAREYATAAVPAAAERVSRQATTIAANTAAGQVLALQMAAGNRAVAELVRPRQPTLARCAGRCSCGGKCGSADTSCSGPEPALVRRQTPQRRTLRRTRTPVIQRSPGSPAGGCGVCYGSPRAAGIVAHELITSAFETFYRGLVVTELPFFAPAPGDEDGRLDLAQPTPTGFNIGEIKPANAAGLLQADVDLMWYEAQIRRLFGMRVGRMTLPPPPMSLVFPNPQAPGCPAQGLTVERWPQPDGIYVYSCEPDFSELVRDQRCRCGRRREPVRVPVPVPAPEPARRPVRAPRTVLEKIRDFVNDAVEGGRNAEEAARRFLEENPEVRQYLAAALIGAAILIVIITLAEDIATLGAGLLDDPASFAAAFALVRVAQQMGR